MFFCHLQQRQLITYDFFDEIDKKSQVSWIVDGRTAMVFAEGRMEGVGGKYENDYAIKYTLNETGQIIEQKEYLSDILLATQLYGQEICGEKKTL